MQANIFSQILLQEKVEHFSHSRTESCGFLHKLYRRVAYPSEHRTFTVMGRLIVAYLICGKEGEMCESRKHQGYTIPHTRNQGHAADKKNYSALTWMPWTHSCIIYVLYYIKLKHIFKFPSKLQEKSV